MLKNINGSAALTLEGGVTIADVSEILELRTDRDGISYVRWSEQRSAAYGSTVSYEWTRKNGPSVIAGFACHQ